MTHREKVVKLMELRGEFEHVKAEIDMFRYPLGQRGPQMLAISQEEENSASSARIFGQTEQCCFKRNED